MMMRASIERSVQHTEQVKCLAFGAGREIPCLSGGAGTGGWRPGGVKGSACDGVNGGGVSPLLTVL